MKKATSPGKQKRVMRPWSDAEKDLLRKHYATLHGKDLYKLFPNRATYSIITQASRMGLTGTKSNRGCETAKFGEDNRCTWSDEEINLLKQLYHTMSAKKLHRLYFPHHSKDGIRWKAASLGLYRHPPKEDAEPDAPWTEEEIRILTEHYPSTFSSRIQENLLPNHSREAIIQKARELGVRKAAWTPEKDDILRKHYGQITARQIHDTLLPEHSIQSIQQRAHRIGISDESANRNKVRRPKPKQKPKQTRRAWTPEEDQILKSYHDTLVVKDIRRLLPQRAERTIRTRLQKLGLTFKKAGPAEYVKQPWTQDEVQIIRSRYPAMSVTQIQQAFLPHRSTSSIYAKLDSLDLQ